MTAFRFSSLFPTCLLSFAFDHPWRLLCLLALVPVVWLAIRNLQALDPVRRWVSVSLRAAVILVITLMLAGLHTVRTHDRLTVAAVIDQSESVKRYAPQAVANAGAVHQLLTTAGQDIRPDDRFIYLTYDGQPQIATRSTSELSLAQGTVKRPIDGTHTAAAIRQAVAAKADTTSALRIVVATDGNDTHGDTLTAIEEAVAAGIEVDLIPIRYALQNEVMVESVHARLEAVEGQTIRVATQLRATRPTAGTLELFHDRRPAGSPIAVTDEQWTRETAEATSRARSDSGSASGDSSGGGGQWIAQIAVDVPLGQGSAGRHVFESQFTPRTETPGTLRTPGTPTPGSGSLSPSAQSGSTFPGDGLASNNRGQAVTLVRGQGRVLVVDNVGGDAGRVLVDRLRGQGLVVQSLPAEAISDSLGQLHAYDAIVLQNVPADQVTGAQQQAMADYVQQLGGGLVMIGGPKSFGAGAWTNTPIDQVLPVTCQLPSQRVLPSGALMIVIDRSGSMGDANNPSSKQRMANESAILALRTLYEDDLVGVIAFDGGHETIVELGPNTNALQTERKIARIGSGGGTNIASGLQPAVDALSQQQVADSAIKHIVLVTDGHDGTSVNNYADMLRAMASNGVTLSTIAIGSDAGKGLLSDLAAYGGGAFHEVDDPTQLTQVFIKEAQTIRKNLIREDRFEPVLESTNSPVTAGMSSFPPLEGLVLTGPREDPSVQMPLTDPEGNPVFAHWQTGLGRTAAFTSDATTRWGVNWTSWSGYNDFWSRMMRYVARPSESSGYDLQTRIQDDQLVIRLDTTAPGTPGSGQTTTQAMTVQGAVIKPDDSAEAITLAQTAPGIYETRLPAREAGHYLVSLNMKTTGGQRQRVFAGASRAKGQELANLSSNNGLLQQIAETINGRVYELPPEATSSEAASSSGGSGARGETGGLFERRRDLEVRSMLPVWHKLMPWLLGLLMLDIACRRIAWNGTEIWQTLKNPQTAAAAEASMAGALKATRKQTKRAAQKSKRAKTFTAPTDQPAKALAQTKTQAAPSSASVTRTEPTAEPETPPSSTNRLLAAKRRAQERFDD